MSRRSWRWSALAFLLLVPAMWWGQRPWAAPLVTRDDLRYPLDSAGVRGVFVLQRVDPVTGLGLGPVLTSDQERAREPYIPAETFDIPNALIAVELGIIKDERTRVPMTWAPQRVPEWNREQTFASAIKYSVVPVQQIVARQVGEARYRRWLDRIDYGNAAPKGGVDHFWLDGTLRTSATGQLRFLGRFAARTLPFAERSQRIVQAMLVSDANACWVIHGKQGIVGTSTTRPLDNAQRVAWYVGWVETDTATTVFALNIDATPGAAAKRLPLTKALLKRAGAIPKRCEDDVD